MTDHKPRTKPVLVSLFRYSLHDHEAMVNTYPHVLVQLSHDMQVHHFCSRGQSRHWLTDQPGIIIHELPIYFRRSSDVDKWLKTILWYVLACRIAWWARRHRASLIYIEEGLPLLPGIMSRISSRPVAISAADVFWDVYLPDRGFYRWIKHWLVNLDIKIWKKLRGLTTHTQAFREYAINSGVKHDRVVVIPEACNDASFFQLNHHTARREAGYRDDEFIILHHGLMVPNKNLDKLLEFIAPILYERPFVKLEFAGDGPVRRNLEAIVKKMNLQNQVRFRGWLPSANALNTLINAADVSVVIRAGRFSDHFHITANLLHSMTCGSTILAVRLKGISEFIEDGVNGLLFSPTDREEFRRQLIRLLDDKLLRQRLSEAARETAQLKLNPQHVTNAWAGAIRMFATSSCQENKTA